MLTLNLSQVRKAIQDDQQKPKPRMVISFKESGVTKSVTAKENVPQSDSPLKQSHQKSPKKNESLSAECWNDYNQLRIEQSKVANEIHALVDTGDKKAIADLYARVESYRPELIRLFERARHVDQYGVLPNEAVTKLDTAETTADIFSLKDHKRKLVDRRCKLQAKIAKGKATNAPKLPEWEMQLDEADLEYKSVDDKIKKLEGKL